MSVGSDLGRRGSDKARIRVGGGGEAVGFRAEEVGSPRLGFLSGNRQPYEQIPTSGWLDSDPNPRSDRRRISQWVSVRRAS